MHLKRSYLIFFISIFCLVITKHSNAQTVEDIIGNWKVVKVELTPDAKTEEKNAFEMVNTMFLQTMFNINSDNSFSFITTNKDLTIPSATWSYNSTTKTITVIGIAPDTQKKGLLMEIIVNIIEGNYLFKLNETPVILTVLKT